MWLARLGGAAFGLRKSIACNLAEPTQGADTFFDWFAPNRFTFPIFGGVPDSTLGWSAPLPVESRRPLVNPPSKKIIGKHEEMPLAA